jgi:hypothetical protein
MTLDPHTAVLVASAAGIGLSMSLAGLQKNALEWKRRRRICPSCGLVLRSGACRCTQRL